MTFKKIFLLTMAFITTSTLFGQRIVETVWGKEIIDDVLIEQLLDHPIMTRLQYIDQSGPHLYFGILPKFNRYEHSVGVLALLASAQRNQKECVAGLLHDASHTVFSHLADVLFKKETHSRTYEEKNHSYQDDVHLDFLATHNINQIVEAFGIILEELNPDLNEYTALERPLPHLCADRIQYNIHTGIILNLISTDQAREIINNLAFDNEKWYFTDILIAKRFALLSVHFTEFLWGAPYNAAFYHYFAQALRRAIELNIISYDDIHYSTDAVVFEILAQADDAAIQHSFELCDNIYQSFMTVAYGQGDLNIKPKCRAIDPLLLIDGGFKTLSEIDEDFKERFNAVQAWCKAGYGLLLMQ